MEGGGKMLEKIPMAYCQMVIVIEVAQLAYVEYDLRNIRTNCCDHLSWCHVAVETELYDIVCQNHRLSFVNQ